MHAAQSATGTTEHLQRTSHSADAEGSIEWRQDFMLRKLFEAVPDIELKDNQRLFTRRVHLHLA